MYAGEFEEDSGGPIVKDRLFEPRLAVEARSDPVAGFGHVASDPGVARFVRSDEADGAQVAEITYIEGGDDEDDPADAGGGGARRGVDWSV